MSDGKLHEGHRGRMRSRVEAQGADTLEPHELLELYLYPFIPRKDTNLLAHQLIDAFGSFSKVLDADIDSLMRIPNMTYNAAVAISSMPAMITLYMKDKAAPKKAIKNIADAVQYIRNEARFLTKERVFILCLDLHYNLLQSVVIRSEESDRAQISFKEIHNAVLRFDTKSIILAHNHPAGSLLPSPDDISLTRDMIASMAYIDVDVADHIIVSEKGYYSFSEKGLMAELRNKKPAEKKKLAAEDNNPGVIDIDES